jgi:Fic family protein
MAKTASTKPRPAGKPPRIKHDPARPYNDLPRLPPAADLETRDILKRCVGAHRELAELRLAGHLLPDDSVLITAIPTLEARASSEIENIVTTNDSLFREASLGGGDRGTIDPAAKEALRYRGALHRGFETLTQRPITTRLATDICRMVTGTDLDVRATPGTALKNVLTGETIYTPPEGAEVIRAMLADWERYINDESDIDPLIRMAVQHYQFEAIHPFGDGNGRTGRILNLLFLVQAGLLERPTLYLSRYILRTRASYYANLSNVTRNGGWQDWVLYVLTGVEETARWTNQKVRAVRALMDETARHIREEKPRLYSHELVQLVFSQPYCRIENATEVGLGNRVTVAGYFKQLVAMGILVEERAWRDKVFINRKYLDLLSSDEHVFEPYPAPLKPVAKPQTKSKESSRG